MHQKRPAMINAISRFFTRLIERFIPDAFVFALLLTFLTLALCLGYTEHNLSSLIVIWGDGFFNLLSFAMQMVLILVLGMTLAQTGFAIRIIGGLVYLAKTERQAAILIVLFSSLFCWLNWGLGLVLGGIIAQKMMVKFPKLNFGTALGLSYGGFLIWHGGLSGSIPLIMSSGDKVMSYLELKPVSLSQTIFSEMNLTLTALTVLFLVLVAALIPITQNDETPIEDDFLVRDDLDHEPKYLNEKLENNFFITLLPVALIFFYVGSVITKGLNLNLVNLILFALALFFHGKIRNFIKTFQSSLGSASGIIIAFPFYAGIMALISGSGLGEGLINFILSFAGPKNFYLLTYLGAGLVNFFVPSGGGQWVVQGPVTLAAAQGLGLSISKSAVAISWGDAWTNMVQPFWAIPLLSMAGLKLRDIMPICLFLFAGVGVITSLYLYFGM